jgi:hypothetical protein
MYHHYRAVCVSAKPSAVRACSAFCVAFTQRKARSPTPPEPYRRARATREAEERAEKVESPKIPQPYALNPI